MTRIIFSACLAAGVLATALTAAYGYDKDDLHVQHPWARATPPGAKVAAGYLEIRNSGKKAERLIGVSSPAAERVELHVQVRDGDVLKMREVRSFDVPPAGQLTLRPGGSHLMLVNIRKPLVSGQRIPLTLRFELAGELQVELAVGAAETAGHSHH